MIRKNKTLCCEAYMSSICVLCLFFISAVSLGESWRGNYSDLDPATVDLVLIENKFLREKILHLKQHTGKLFLEHRFGIYCFTGSDPYIRFYTRWDVQKIRFKIKYTKISKAYKHYHHYKYTLQHQTCDYGKWLCSYFYFKWSSFMYITCKAYGLNWMKWASKKCHNLSV